MAGRAQSVFVPQEPPSKLHPANKSFSAGDVVAGSQTTSPNVVSITGPDGTEKLGGAGDREVSDHFADADGAKIPENDAEFDVYKFLNENGSRVLRDPVLQQMTVVKYEGELDQTTGFFQGQGKLVSTLGYSYQGTFEGGLMHGNGKIEWTDGTVYEGTFKDNVISGSGKYSWPTGDWYEGDVEECVRHGKGTFFYKSLNETYEGSWLKGMRHGQGTLKYTPDGSISYTGGWVRDKRNGEGKMRYAFGSYEGEWKNDIRHGQGRMIWKQEDVVVEEYKGEWVGGVPCGQGSSTYIRPPAEGVVSPTTGVQIQAPTTVSQQLSPNSTFGGTASNATSQTMESHFIKRDAAINSYSGEFHNGLRHGFGTFIYDDGSKYEGQWHQNQKHGEGKYTSATGVVYFGSFQDGNPITPVNENKPDTTVSSPLPLYIRDILGESENNVQEAITAVQSVISRNSGLLKKLFSFYSNMDSAIEVVTTPSSWKQTRTQGNITLIQFLRMCNDAKLINRHTSIVAIDKLLLAFRDRNATTSTSSYMTGEQTAQQQQQQIGSLSGGAAGGSTLSPNAGAMAGSTTSPTDLGGSNKGGSGNFNESATTSPARGGAPLSDSSQSPATNLEKPDKAGSRSERNSVSSLRSSRGGRMSSTRADPYSAPWERYQSELHTFLGELNYREFVEAIVRITDHHYESAKYGTLAHKLTVVIEEHLTPFTCSKQNGDPLFPLSREHRSVVSPHLELLQKYFLHYSKASAFGLSKSPTSSSSSSSSVNVAGHTISVRQFSLMLKDLGAVDGEKLSFTNIPKMSPYDRHPALTTAVGKKLLMTTSPVRQGTASSDDQSRGLGATTSERGSTYSLEVEPHFVEGGETIYRSRCNLSKRSKGVQNANLHATLVMEQELTFVEFVDMVIKAAVLRNTENTQTQRVGAFLQQYIVTKERKLLAV